MRSLALAGLTALLVTSIARAAEPKARSTASGDASKSDDQSGRLEGPIAKQYAQILAEFEAEQAGYRQAAAKADGSREKRAVADKRPRDLVVHYSRRMVDLAESSSDDPAARDALLWVINKPGRGDMGVVREFDLTDEEYAYHLELRQCDPQVIRAEAERLFEEVISEYGALPHITRHRRELEELLNKPTPQWNGKPLTDEGRRQIEGLLARKKTLGQEAEARLDEMLNLAVGKPAPEIEGLDVDGNRLKLSDYKGKVVVLVFWGSWCGPCMEQVAHERDRVERLKGQSFAILGVDCEPNKDTARQVMARERMTWPNWYDGAPGVGPIATRYHVRAIRLSSSSMLAGSSALEGAQVLTRLSTSCWKRLSSRLQIGGLRVPGPKKMNRLDYD